CGPPPRPSSVGLASGLVPWAAHTLRARQAGWCARRVDLVTPAARSAPSDDPCEAGVRGRARDAAALGHGFARDLFDIGGERDRRRGADRHPDTIRMDGALRGLELPYPIRVQAPRNKNPDVTVSA